MAGILGGGFRCAVVVEVGRKHHPKRIDVVAGTATSRPGELDQIPRQTTTGHREELIDELPLCPTVSLNEGMSEIDVDAHLREPEIYTAINPTARPMSSRVITDSSAFSIPDSAQIATSFVRNVEDIE
ncbi:hypothetical protein [Rhodococcus sp. YL-1]|uniref:hypothetical protein n=1 Tax=Rhodococcus sp. YL-1 TaxID=1045808 RepID=UPI003FA6A640